MLEVIVVCLCVYVCVCECVPSQSLPILTRARSSCEIPKQQSTFLYQFKPILDKHRSFGDQRLFHQQTLEFQPFFLYIVPGVAVAGQGRCRFESRFISLFFFFLYKCAVHVYLLIYCMLCQTFIHMFKKMAFFFSWVQFQSICAWLFQLFLLSLFCFVAAPVGHVFSVVAKNIAALITSSSSRIQDFCAK